MAHQYGGYRGRLRYRCGSRQRLSPQGESVVLASLADALSLVNRSPLLMMVCVILKLVFLYWLLGTVSLCLSPLRVGFPLFTV